MTLTDFAAEIGVSRVAVWKGVRSGRLSTACVTKVGRRLRVTDPALARHEWEANASRPTKANGKSNGTGLQQALTAAAVARTERAQFELQVRQGQFIDARQAIAG